MKHILSFAVGLLFFTFLGCASKVSSMPRSTIRKQTPESVLSHSSKKKMDLNKIPAELHSLVPLVQRWGGVSSDEEVYNLADVAESDEAYIEEFEKWLHSWTNEQHKAYEKWNDSTLLEDSEEFWKFYFMFM